MPGRAPPFSYGTRCMAQKGYIIFSLDNRGSAGRGHIFEQPVHCISVRKSFPTSATVRPGSASNRMWTRTAWAFGAGATAGT